jgi:hypothetical protein
MLTRVLLLEPVTFGVGWIDQLVPFHRSASVEVAPALTYEPTAVHALAAVHERPRRTLPVAADGLGVDWIAQPLPVCTSASVIFTSELLT